MDVICHLIAGAIRMRNYYHIQHITPRNFWWISQFPPLPEYSVWLIGGCLRVSVSLCPKKTRIIRYWYLLFKYGRQKPHFLLRNPYFSKENVFYELKIGSYFATYVWYQRRFVSPLCATEIMRVITSGYNVSFIHRITYGIFPVIMVRLS